MKPFEEKIYSLLKNIAQENNYNIVDIKILGEKYTILQILLEKQDNTAITIGDCSTFSKSASAILDVADVFKNRYTLEVGSAGINRPLITKEDFIKFKDNDIIIKTKVPQEGKKVFKGRLLGIEEERVKIISEELEIVIDFDKIFKANLDIIKNDNI